MECFLSGFMVREGLLRFASPKRFSLSRRQAWIGAFLVVAHFLYAFSLNPAGFSLAFAARGAC
jgi:hypothetical protein